jgi:hypothetical protein
VYSDWSIVTTYVHSFDYVHLSSCSEPALTFTHNFILYLVSDKEKEERLNLAGALMRVDMRSLFLFESFKSPLLKHGISEAKFEEWVKRAYEG